MIKYTQLEIENMIREAGLKVTDHRVNILLKISKSRVPVAVHKIIDDLQKKYHIDQATVYRNLSTLEEAALVRKSSYNQGYSYYELADTEDVNKIICSRCEAIEKISGIQLDDIIKKMYKKSKKFKNYKDLKVEIYSFCKSCG